jgi:hypothetical protein
MWGLHPRMTAATTSEQVMATGKQKLESMRDGRAVYIGAARVDQAVNSLVVRNQSGREAPWERFHATVDGLLEWIKVPGRS